MRPNRPKRLGQTCVCHEFEFGPFFSYRVDAAAWSPNPGHFFWASIARFETERDAKIFCRAYRKASKKWDAYAGKPVKRLEKVAFL